MLLVFITNNVWREHRRRFSWFYFTVSSRTFFFPLWLILFNSQNSWGNLSTVVGHTKVTCVERVFTGTYVHARIYLYSICYTIAPLYIWHWDTLHVGLTISYRRIISYLYYIMLYLYLLWQLPWFIQNYGFIECDSIILLYFQTVVRYKIRSVKYFAVRLCCTRILYTIICITATRNWSASSRDYYNIILLYTACILILYSVPQSLSPFQSNRFIL